MPGIITYLRLLPVLLCHVATIWTPSARAATARLLIYSATREFRHDSIPAAIAVLQEKGPSIDAIIDATENPSQFTDSNLARYDALIFLSTTGEVLPNDRAFQRYINAGGNFVGIHSAADTLNSSTAFLRELGSHFDNHPPLQFFTVDNLEPDHPTVSMLPRRWSIRDEPYNFNSDPRGLGAKVVLGADESTYDDDRGSPKQGSPHPIAWYQEKGAGVQSGGIAGRSFYTGLGHLTEMWTHDNLFVGHVLGGITWVLNSNTTRAFNTTALVGNPQPSSTLPSTSSTQSRTTQPTGNNSASQKSSTFWFICLWLSIFY